MVANGASIRIKVEGLVPKGASVWMTALYTSPETLRSSHAKLPARELCFIINDCRDADDDSLLRHAAVITRAITSYLAHPEPRPEDGGQSLGEIPVPAKYAQDGWADVRVVSRRRTARMPSRILQAASPHIWYRTPRSLSTTSKSKVAINFARDRGGSELALWRFTLPVFCRHVRKPDRVTLVPGESEWLFPPYSAFQVTHFEENDTDLGRCVIDVTVSADNKPVSENLHSAPWL